MKGRATISHTLEKLEKTAEIMRTAGKRRRLSSMWLHEQRSLMVPIGAFPAGAHESGNLNRSVGRAPLRPGSGNDRVRPSGGLRRGSHPKGGSVANEPRLDGRGVRPTITRQVGRRSGGTGAAQSTSVWTS
jgi:hypothetical protein